MDHMIPVPEVLLLSIKDVCHAYNGRKALDGLSLELQTGEVLGLLGPNGAGKSTLMALITGLLKPDSGQVLLGAAGQSPAAPGARRLLGLAPQENALYEDLSARENLCFFARLQGLSGRRLKERVAGALQFAGLSDRADEPVSRFSGGMKRRLNLVTALVHDPAILLLDEPTVGVDPQSRNGLLENVETLRGEGRSILYATHYMEEAQRVCDRVAILDEGRLLDLGTVPELLKRHGGSSRLEALVAGERVVEICDDPVAALSALAGRGTLEEVVLKRPDLETVFLNLTGRQLRDL